MSAGGRSGAADQNLARVWLVRCYCTCDVCRCTLLTPSRRPVVVSSGPHLGAVCARERGRGDGISGVVAACPSCCTTPTPRLLLFSRYSTLSTRHSLFSCVDYRHAAPQVRLISGSCSFGLFEWQLRTCSYHCLLWIV